MIKSEIAKDIETTNQKAQYDSCVKKLLSEKIILAWILKECVEEFKPFSITKKSVKYTASGYRVKSQ